MSKPAKEINLLQKANSSGTVSKFLLYTKIRGQGIWLALAALSAGSLVGSIGIGQRLGTGSGFRHWLCYWEFFALGHQSYCP